MIAEAVNNTLETQQEGDETHVLFWIRMKYVSVYELKCDESTCKDFSTLFSTGKGDRKLPVFIKSIC